MAVSDIERRSDIYLGNGVTTEFAYPFKIFAASDLEVRQIDADDVATVLMLNGEYTVAGVDSDGGGVVTLVNPLPTGERLVIIGAQPFDQPLVLFNQGPYFAVQVMRALDRNAVLSQQLSERLARAVQYPPETPAKTGPEFEAAVEARVAAAAASASAAATSATAADADATATAADRVQTGLDRVAAAVSAEAAAASAGFRDFADVAVLLADTALAYGAGSSQVAAGDIIRTRAEGFSYEVAASAATDQHVTTAGGVKLYVLPGEKGLNAHAFGMPTGGDDQALLTKMWFSDATALHMPPGVYRGYIDNRTSGRTIYWDEGAICDGTVHIAGGTGPDSTSAATITWVDNTRVIGTIVSTVRVGTFYCRGLHIDGLRITEVNAAYVNQTAEGGTNGVHIYFGSKDFNIGEILIESATDGTYAVGIDRGPTNNADHLVENGTIGRIVVHGNTQSVLSTLDTVNLSIGEIIADSWDNQNAFRLTGDTNLNIDRIKAVPIVAPVTAGRDGIYVLNGVSARFGVVEIEGSTQIGFRTFNSGRVDAGTIISRGNALDQVRIESPGTIGEIRAGDGGTGVGVLVQGAGNNVSIGKITSDGGGAVQVNSDDVSIPEIVSRNNALIGSGYGVWLNGCDRFVNRLLLADSNTQGLRMNNNIDTTLGAMIVQNNTFGIVGSGISGFAYDTVIYGGNVDYDSNVIFETLPGFRGKRTRQGVSADRGDASVTVVVGNDAVTQRFGTALTVDRTVTLSTAGAQNGDKFRVARSAVATGAFTLGVAPLAGLGTKTLAVGQWLDAEFQGTSWHLTGFGSL